MPRYDVTEYFKDDSYSITKLTWAYYTLHAQDKDDFETYNRLCDWDKASRLMRAIKRKLF